MSRALRGLAGLPHPKIERLRFEIEEFGRYDWFNKSKSKFSFVQNEAMKELRVHVRTDYY